MGAELQGAGGYRVGDADRNRTADLLKEAHAAGYLTLEEADERLGSAGGRGRLGRAYRGHPRLLLPVAAAVDLLCVRPPGSGRLAAAPLVTCQVPARASRHSATSAWQARSRQPVRHACRPARRTIDAGTSAALD
jgi:hypothetical protein